MIIIKQDVINLFGAFFLVGQDMSEEQKKAIDFDDLTAIIAAPLTEQDVKDGLPKPTVKDIKLTVAKLFIAVNKIPDDQII
jgi:hypothetical protein